MYYQDEAEKKERRRLITFAVTTVVLILILIVAIVVVATKKAGSNKVTEGVNSEFIFAEENTNESETEKTEEKTTETEENKSSETVGTLSTTTNDAPVVISGASDLPTTGPEDLLPLALVLGALTTFGASAAMAKREQ